MARQDNDRVKVGIDVGGTKTEALAVDRNGRVVARAQRATDRGARGVTGTILSVLAELSVNVPAARFVTIGIGVPGQVAQGAVRNAVNLDLVDFELADEISRNTGVPVHLENDVNAAAFGVYSQRVEHQRERAGESLAYLNLGTGVAAGLILDGQVWRGPSGSAGEIGHVVVDPDGPPCPCGQRGCIETLAGGGAVMRRWRRDQNHTLADVFDASESGDPLALALCAGLAVGVAAAIRVLALSVDPASIVIGGGVARLGERLATIVRRELLESSESSPFLRSLQLDQRIEILPPDSVVGALGAALVPTAAIPSASRDTEVLIPHG